ncbi:MAG: hypothetical protein WA152_03695 [Microgenomates group bacterium]
MKDRRKDSLLDNDQVYNLLNEEGCILNHAQEYHIKHSQVSSVIKFDIEGIQLPINSEPYSLAKAVKILDEQIFGFSEKYFIDARDLVQLAMGGGTIEPQENDTDTGVNHLINLDTYLKFAKLLSHETVGYLRANLLDNDNKETVKKINTKFKFLSTVIKEGEISAPKKILTMAEIILK